MKKLLFYIFTVFALTSVNAQTILFQDGFEDYEDFIITDIGDWVTNDVDGSITYGIYNLADPYDFPHFEEPYAFMVFNAYNTNPPAPVAWQARTGQKSLMAMAAQTPPNDDWIISPEITLPESEESLTLNFWAKSVSALYGLERFKIAISDGSTDISDFTVISDGDYIQAPVDWTQYSYDLNAYAGTTIRFAINCVSNDAWGFLVDDISVQEGSGGSGYCIPAFTAVTDFIVNFGLEDIQNNDSGQSAGGYGDYTSMSTDLNADQVYTATLTSSYGSGSHGVAVWIDFDDNGTFDDSERVGHLDGIYPDETHDISLTIPADVSGQHRLRVIYQYNIAGEEIDPCASATYGEAEDYMVNIIGGEPGGPCDEKIIMECGETYTVTLVPNEGEWVNYTDVPYDYTGSEQVFEFTAPETGTYVFEVDEGTSDADFFLMDACSNTATNLLGWYWVGYGGPDTIDLVGGTTYYIIADLFYPSTATTVTVKVNCPETPEPGCSQSTPSNNFENGHGNLHLLQVANDFTVGADESFTVENLTMNIIVTAGATIDAADIYFYKDTDGAGPGEQQGDAVEFVIPTTADMIGSLGNYDVYQASFDITPTELEGTSGEETTYWAGVTIYTDATSSFWEGTSILNTENEGYLYNSNTDTWNSISATFDSDPFDGVFTISGQCNQLGVSDMTSFDFAYYPNPVKDVLNISSGKTIENVTAYNLAGQSVLQSAKVTNGQINVSALPAGVYVFRVTLQGGQVETFKIFKSK